MALCFSLPHLSFSLSLRALVATRSQLSAGDESDGTPEPAAAAIPPDWTDPGVELQIRSRTGVAINGKSRSECCSAVAIDAPSSLTGVLVIRWGVDRQVDGCVSMFLFCFIDCSLSYLTSNGISLPSPLVIQKLTDS